MRTDPFALVANSISSLAPGLQRNWARPGKFPRIMQHGQTLLGHGTGQEATGLPLSPLESKSTSRPGLTRWVLLLAQRGEKCSPPIPRGSCSITLGGHAELALVAQRQVTRT